MKTLDTWLARLDAMLLPPPELLRNLAAEEEPAKPMPVSTTAAGIHTSAAAAATPAGTDADELAVLLHAMGGRGNIAEADGVSLTRLRVALRTPVDGPARARIDAAASACGVLAVMWCSDTVAHLVAGGQAPVLALRLQAALAITAPV